MDRLEGQLEKFLGASSRLGEGVYLASTATVIGDVTLGDRSSVWYGAVLRGDINRIEVGEKSNIQDNAVVHLADDFPAIIGDRVTVGHGAVVHACRVEDECLVGIRSVILDGAVVGKGSMIGAGALVTQGMEIPPGSLVLGSPGKVVRALTDEEKEKIVGLAEKYVAIAGYCLANKIQVGSPLGS